MTEKALKEALEALSPEERDRLREVENREWRESLEYVLRVEGPERVEELLRHLDEYLYLQGFFPQNRLNTPYLNTIPKELEPPYPGDLGMELRIANILRWNAAMMVARANKKADGIGGHISTYASIAELYEVGFNHFFRGRGRVWTGTWSSSRATPPPVSMPGPSWRAGFPRRTWRTSGGRSTPRWRGDGGFPATPTPGSCRTSGSFPRCPWAWGPSRPSIRPASCATWRTGV
jgi:hypothetical protein